MKRINPATGTFFKFGDIREDGKVFTYYKTKKLLKNGYFKEDWYPADKFQNIVERHKTQQKNYGKTKNGTLSGIHRSAKTRSKNKNLPINIDLKYLKQIVTDTCPIFGTPFKWDNPTMKQDSPTLDRIIPELGYVKGNVRIVSNLANTMKSNATPEQLLLFAKWVIKTYGTDKNSRKNPSGFWQEKLPLAQTAT